MLIAIFFSMIPNEFILSLSFKILKRAQDHILKLLKCLLLLIRGCPVEIQTSVFQM